MGLEGEDFLGDDDDVEVLKPMASATVKAVETWRAPGEIDQLDFLVHMGWTDSEVYLRQPLWWYHRCWRIYKFQAITGTLLKGLFG